MDCELSAIEIYQMRIIELEKRLEKPIYDSALEALIKSNIKLNKILLEQEMIIKQGTARLQ